MYIWLYITAYSSVSRFFHLSRTVDLCGSSRVLLASWLLLQRLYTFFCPPNGEFAVVSWSFHFWMFDLGLSFKLNYYNTFSVLKIMDILFTMWLPSEMMAPSVNVFFFIMKRQSFFFKNVISHVSPSKTITSGLIWEYFNVIWETWHTPLYCFGEKFESNLKNVTKYSK